MNNSGQENIRPIHADIINPSETDIVWNALLGLKEIFREVLKEVREE